MVLTALVGVQPASAAGKWTEYNLGPFYLATDSDSTAVRYDLTQLEQARWVLGGLLDSKDLNATWPFRILITRSAKPTPHLVLRNGYYLLIAPPESPMPLGEVAQLFLDANTPRFPAEVEVGIAKLFNTLKANGSRVTWGGRPAEPDLAFARMQLFATKFEYGASFHIFLSSLRNGSTIHAAEHNAFGKSSDLLEEEASARLQAHDWQAVATSGRPLDPKRDFGDHSLDESTALVSEAAAQITTDVDAAETALKNLLNQTSPAKALIYGALADVAIQRQEKPDEFLATALQSGSKDASVYVRYAEDLPAEDALPLLKKAHLLNPLWAEPLVQQAELTEDMKEREALLKQAVKMNPRSTDYWVALARTQMNDGHSVDAQSSWLRAEESAADEKRRKFVHQLHESMEAARLDKVESDRKQEQNASVLADQHAQQSEADRIHAAEERANKANSAESHTGSDSNSVTDSNVVDYDKLVKTEKTYGTVVLVECRNNYVRVAVRDLRGRTRTLLYRGDDSEHKIFSCSNKPERRQIVVTFRPKDDSVHGTDGDIVSIAWR